MAQVYGGRLYGPTQGQYQKQAGQAVAEGISSGVKQGVQVYQAAQVLQEQKRVTNLKETMDTMKNLVKNQYGGNWKQFFEDQPGLAKSYFSLLRPGQNPDALYKEVKDNLPQTVPQMMQEGFRKVASGETQVNALMYGLQGGQQQQQQVGYTPEPQQQHAAPALGPAAPSPCPA